MKNFTKETLRHGESGDRFIGSSGQRIWGCDPINRSSKQFLHAWRLVLAALREIFDESSYDRFLARTCATRSVESYREFLDEREAIVARRLRCC